MEITDETKDYSSGEDCSEFDFPFLFLTKEEKKQRCQFLWHRAYVKARGGAIILEKFGEVHRNILLFGTTKNINVDRKKAEKDLLKNKNPCIILPESRFKKFWNFVIMLLLLYTASFVPVKTAFFDNDP